MTHANYIRNAIAFDTSRTPRDSFGKPMLMSEHSLYPERTRTFSTRQALLDVGFSSSSAVVGMFDVMMGQEFRPPSLVVGRREVAVAQVETFTVGGAGDGAYTHPVNGAAATFSASGDTATAIRDGLVAAINALGEPVTAAPVSTDQYTVTADNSGQAFTTGTLVSPSDVLTGVETTANVGAYTELQAIREYDQSWYAALSDDRTTPDLLEASRWVQSARAIFVGQTDDADILNPALDTDIASQLLALQRSRTMLLYKSSDADYFDAALLGKQLPKTPGSTNWAWQTLRDVPSDSLSYDEVEAMRAKRVGHLITMGVQPTAFEGKMSAAGMWVDLVRGGDKIDNDIEAGKLDLFQGMEKVGFDELQIIADRIEVEIRRNTSLVLEDSVEVTLPAEVPESDISARRVLGIEWKASIRTPVNEVDTAGQLTIGGVV